MNTKSLIQESIIIISGTLVAVFLYIYMQPDRNEHIDYKNEISETKILIKQLESADVLPLLTDSWIKSHLIASYFGASIAEDKKEVLKGGITSSQPAFFGRISSTKSMNALAAAWLIERTLPATIQNVNITESDTTISIAVLGRKQ